MENRIGTNGNPPDTGFVKIARLREQITRELEGLRREIFAEAERVGTIALEVEIAALEAGLAILDKAWAAWDENLAIGCPDPTCGQCWAHRDVPNERSQRRRQNARR